MTIRAFVAALALAVGLSPALATVIPGQPPFQPTPSWSQLAVGATSSRVALPTGSTIIVYNTGSNAAFVALGGASVAASAANDQVAPGGFLCLSVGSATYLAGIETGGATGLNISGGSGMCAGSGGGGISTSSTSWPGSASPSAYGSAPSGTVPGVNAFMTGRGWSLSSASDSIAVGSLPALPTGSNVIGGAMIYDAAGHAIMADSYNGVYFLHVDQSSAATDGATYNLTNVPQVNVGAGKGSDGFVHSIATDASGNQIVNLNAGSNAIGSVIANAGTNLNTSALALETGGNLSTIAGAVSGGVVQGNAARVGGTAVSTGSGATGSGSQRMTVAQDSTTVAGASSLPAGSNTIGKVDLLGGSGAALDSAAGASNGQAVTIQGNASGVPVPAMLNSTPSLANGNGVVIANGALAASVKAASTPPSSSDLPLVVTISPITSASASAGATPVGDPCQFQSKLNATVYQTASGTLITGATGKKNYICSFTVGTSASANISLVEYSGACTGGTAYADLGSTTASQGWPLAANGGLTYGNGGGTVISGGGNTNTGYNVCLLQNGTANVTAQVTYVQQ